MMKRKDYVKPALQVVELRQTGMLMMSDPEQQEKKQQYVSEEW